MTPAPRGAPLGAGNDNSSFAGAGAGSCVLAGGVGGRACSCGSGGGGDGSGGGGGGFAMVRRYGVREAGLPSSFGASAAGNDGAGFDIVLYRLKFVKSSHLDPSCNGLQHRLHCLPACFLRTWQAPPHLAHAGCPSVGRPPGAAVSSLLLPHARVHTFTPPPHKA
eukprot:236578-Chlamydomonas_euryale.AAC.1